MKRIQKMRGVRMHGAAAKQFIYVVFLMFSISSATSFEFDACRSTELLIDAQ